MKLAAILASSLALLPLGFAAETLPNGIVLPDVWPPQGTKLTRAPLAEPPYLRERPKVIPIDSGRQLFVDDYLVEQSTLKRTHHLPRYHEASPVLSPDRRWDKDHAAPFSDGVWFDERDQLFKMWYWARGDDEAGKPFASTCLATSRDGVRWEKPRLDVVPGTNIVQLDEPGFVRNSGTVWLDHAGKDAASRFKMFRVMRGAEKQWRIRYSASPDGVHWTMVDDSEPVSDRTTVFYNAIRGKWVASLRGGDNTVGRFRRYHEANDVAAMLHWKDSAEWICADELDPAREDLELRRTPERPWDLPPSQLYNLDCVAYESVMLGLFSIWRGQQMPPRPKINEVCVGYSRDGFHWSRPERRAFCPVAANDNAWNSGNLQSSGGCCLVVGDKLHFYVGAVPKSRNFPDPGNVGLAVLRRDGFTSLDAGAETGTLTTRPVVFKGSRLFVNAAAPDGKLTVEILDEAGKIIAPFTRTDCRTISGDSTKREVRWDSASDLAALAGKPVRFRFHLTNGSLYAFWMSRDERGASGGYVAAGGPGFSGLRDE